MTTPADPADLLRRVERLEARFEKGLEVERLVVRGKGGKAVIEMAASPAGEPEIVLSDLRGRERVLIRLVDDECAIEMLDAEGGTRLRAASSDVTTRIVLWPVADGERRAEVRVASDGTAHFAVTEGDAGTRAAIGVDGAGNAIVGVKPLRAGGTPDGTPA